MNLNSLVLRFAIIDYPHAMLDTLLERLEIVSAVFGKGRAERAHNLINDLEMILIS